MTSNRTQVLLATAAVALVPLTAADAAGNNFHGYGDGPARTLNERVFITPDLPLHDDFVQLELVESEQLREDISQLSEQFSNMTALANELGVSIDQQFEPASCAGRLAEVTWMDPDLGAPTRAGIGELTLAGGVEVTVLILEDATNAVDNDAMRAGLAGCADVSVVTNADLGGTELELKTHVRIEEIPFNFNAEDQAAWTFMTRGDDDTAPGSSPMLTSVAIATARVENVTFITQAVIPPGQADGEAFNTDPYLALELLERAIFRVETNWGVTFTD